jgi:hypothetical protein
MKVCALEHSVILHLSPSPIHSMSTLSSRLSQTSSCGHSVISALSGSPSLCWPPSLSFHFTSAVPLAGLSAIMPRECDKPKRGPQYYSFLARRNRPDPSQPSTPTTSTGQNWLDFPFPNTPHSSPPPVDTMPDPGSCPVEEEIPPLGLQPYEDMPRPDINTNPQARPLEQGGCLVEEEIPPSWLKTGLLKMPPLEWPWMKFRQRIWMKFLPAALDEDTTRMHRWEN